jgi:Flp pilus assembly protein TadB
VQALVLKLLPIPEKRVSGIAIPRILIFVIAAFVGFTFYLFRINLYTLASNVSLYAIVAIAIVSVMMIGYRVYKMLRRYQQQIESLNFY